MLQGFLESCFLLLQIGIPGLDLGGHALILFPVMWTGSSCVDELRASALCCLSLPVHCLCRLSRRYLEVKLSTHTHTTTTEHFLVACKRPRMSTSLEIVLPASDVMVFTPSTLSGGMLRLSLRLLLMPCSYWRGLLFWLL